MALALAALILLLLPAGARADHPRAAEEAAIGRAHMLEHAKIWRAQARARTRWAKMSRRERRALRRKHRRATRGSYVRARASADGPSDVGSWAAPFVMTSNYQGYAIHAAMLHTGKVLMWGYPIHVEHEDAWRGNESYAWLWDPSKGYGPESVEDVTPVIDGQNVSIYCSGMSFLPDGRVLVVGGTLSWGVDDPGDEFEEFAGLDKALLFDPADESWTDLPRPAGSHGRWYPTQTLLPDGRTFVISGLSDVAPGGVLNDTHEIYSADGQSVVQLDSAAQRRDTELYPHLFTMPDGKLLLAGPNPADSARFDPGNPADPWTDLPPLADQRIGGTAVLLPEDHQGSSQVALIGGRPYAELPPMLNEMIDLDDSSPDWSVFPGLNVPRSYPNTVLLPDRSMVTVGGDDRVPNWPVPERAVELYDPVTGSWRVGPSQAETRAYHSTALLLPDGRVLSTGDDFNPSPSGDRADSSPNDTGEIYSPPYLFQGPRPAISSAPESVRWNVPFGVGTAGDIDEAVLIAPAAVTHANDMNQRLVPLQTVNEYPGHGVTLQSPPSASVAPPGYYMLFLVNDGVPSVAKWVHLDGAAAEVPVLPPGADEDTTPPETTIESGPTGTVASRSASFEFSSTEAGSSFDCKLDGDAWLGCTSPQGYTGLADGSHTFSVKARDADQNEDATPATRTWTVDATAPETSITSGPEGPVNSTSATFGFSSPEEGATFECSLDSATWSSCSSTKTYSSLADGSYTFYVRAKDGPGNRDPSPASRSWTVDTNAPNTTISGGHAGTVKSTSVSFELSSGESGSTFECRLDDAAWGDCESPVAHSGLADGSHTFSARATDAAGNIDPTPDSRTWTVDTTPPDTLAGTGPGGTEASSSASFTFSSDDWTVTDFECKLDADGWQGCDSPEQATELVDGGHTFQVRAKDTAGNTDPTPASWSWTVDTEAPQTSITAGPDPVAGSTSATFEFSSPDGIGFKCRLDSGDWEDCDSPKSYASLTEGPHTFEVSAIDAAGNEDGSPATHSWTVDLTAPAATIDGGPTGTVNSSSASFTFSSADTGASFECALDSEVDWETCTSPKAYDDVDDGPHTFRVRARDADGVRGIPASRAWTVDTTPPDTTITDGPSEAVASSSASFSFSSADASATFECRLDTGTWAACPSPVDYGPLAEGLHTFEVRAKDAAGNRDAIPAKRTWTVDTSAPDTWITVGPPGTTASDSAWFEFASDDAAAAFECRLDAGAWESCAEGKGYAGLAQGGHTFAVRARDAAGNEDPAPDEQSWTVVAPKPEPEPDPVPDPDPKPSPVPDPEEPTDPDSDAEPDEPDEVADFAGPVLRLDFAERRWLKRLRRKGRLRVQVTVDEPAKVALKLYRGKKRIGRKRARIRRAEATRRLTLRPRRRALRWLRRHSSPQPRFVVVATDTAANDTRWTRLLKAPSHARR